MTDNTRHENRHGNGMLKSFKTDSEHKRGLQKQESLSDSDVSTSLSSTEGLENTPKQHNSNPADTDKTPKQPNTLELDHTTLKAIMAFYNARNEYKAAMSATKREINSRRTLDGPSNTFLNAKNKQRLNQV